MDTLYIPCGECGELIEVTYEKATEIWEWEERTGEQVTCEQVTFWGPDPYQKAQLEVTSNQSPVSRKEVS